MVHHVSPRSAGFSLIELMIAVAVVGVLASVAYPSYTRHIERTDRAQARAALLEAAQYMERYYATQGTYLNAALPARLSLVPPVSVPAGNAVAAAAAAVAARYRVQINVTATTYTVTAASNRAGDECGDLSINHLGVRTASSALGANGQPDPQWVARCWR